PVRAPFATRRSSDLAGRARLLRQLLLESLLLAVLGAVLSLPIGALVMDGIVALMQEAGGEGLDGRLDGVALRFALIAGAGTVVLFGLFPALHASRVSPAQVLRSEAGGSRGGRAALRFRNALATAQVAFSMAALVLSGLFLKSLDNLSRV